MCCRGIRACGKAHEQSNDTMKLLALSFVFALLLAVFTVRNAIRTHKG